MDGVDTGLFAVATPAGMQVTTDLAIRRGGAVKSPNVDTSLVYRIKQEQGAEASLVGIGVGQNSAAITGSRSNAHRPSKRRHRRSVSLRGCVNTEI